MAELRGSTGELDPTGRESRIAAMIGRDAEPLPDIDDPAFGRMFDRFAEARLVLLGEASHGTSEFYRGRAAITRRLIEEHGLHPLRRREQSRRKHGGRDCREWACVPWWCSVGRAAPVPIPLPTAPMVVPSGPQGLSPATHERTSAPFGREVQSDWRETP